MPDNLGWGKAVVYDDGVFGHRIYVFGGVAGTSMLNTAHKYEVASNTWTALANMPAVRRNPMTACIGDTIYVIGGMSTNGYSATRGTVWKYSISGDDWTDMGADSMPDNLGWGKAVVYDDGVFGHRIYVFGGYRRSAIVNACWRFDVTSGTWHEERSLLNSTRSHGGDIIQNVVYCGGGYSPIMSNVQRGEIYRTGIEEGEPNLVWNVSAKSATFIRDFGRISYTLPVTGNVELSVYSTSGRLVKTLVDGVVEAGERSATWNLADQNGRRVANGTYFYRLTVDGRTVSRKAILLN
jgi:hypothetical protein